MFICFNLQFKKTEYNNIFKVNLYLVYTTLKKIYKKRINKNRSFSFK